jgi:spore maturation protein SpmB
VIFDLSGSIIDYKGYSNYYPKNTTYKCPIHYYTSNSYVYIGFNFYDISENKINSLCSSMRYINDKLSIPVDILPIMITRSLSGSATLGIFSEIASNSGANSYTALLAVVHAGQHQVCNYRIATHH